MVRAYLQGQEQEWEPGSGSECPDVLHQYHQKERRQHHHHVPPADDVQHAPPDPRSGRWKEHQ